MTLGEAGASKAEGGRSGMLAVEACGDFRLGLTALKSSGVFNRLPDGAAIFAEGSGDSRGSYRSDSRQRLPYSGGSLGGRFLTPTFCRRTLAPADRWVGSSSPRRFADPRSGRPRPPLLRLTTRRSTTRQSRL